MILGIDTSAEQCAVAVVSGTTVWRQVEPMARGHSECLMAMIEQVLVEAGTEFSGIRRIGVCTGPGSFTGIRVGVAAARGLGLGLSVPVIGVTRFDALVAAMSPASAADVIVPGRGGSVYVQTFNDRLEADGPPVETSGDMPEMPSRRRIGPDPSQTLVDPAWIARLAMDVDPGSPPAPFYLRGADAAPPRDGPPLMLD